MAFVKLDVGILDSTLWVDKDARELFITALLMAVPRDFSDPVPQYKVLAIEKTGFVVPPGWYGFVAAAGPGIIRRCGMDEALGRSALERLGEPEAGSRSGSFDGRRMIRIDGGYLILNYIRYRDKDHTAAQRQRRFRERHAVTIDSNAVTVTPVTQAEADTEAYTLKSKTPAQSPSVSTLDAGEIVERIPMLGGVEFEVRQSFVTELERLYPGVDLPATLKQMRGWCIGNPTKLKTPRGIRKFITGWCERDQNG